MNPKLRLLISTTLAITATAMVGGLFLSKPRPVSASPGSNFPSYVPGSFTFAAPLELTGHPQPPAQQFYQGDGEPEIKVDIFGNIYVTAIQGTPGGTDLWKSITNGTSFVYMGQPDGAQDHCQTIMQCVANGGGDDSIDVSPGGYLYVSSLWLGNVTSSTSYDGGTGGVPPGQRWEVHPAAAGVPADDRQWVAAYGPHTINMTYAANPGVSPPGVIGLFFVKSTDGGKTFGAPVEITGTTALDSVNVEGNLVVDPYNGNLYTAYIPSASNSVINLARSTDGGATWTTTTAYTGPAGTTNRGVFPIVAVDRGGNLHLAFTKSDDNADHTNCHVFLTSTANPSAATPTWTSAVQIDNNGAATHTACQAWIVAGSPGIVDVTWVGSSATSPNTTPFDWHVYFAQVTNAVTGSPTIARNQVETAVIHQHSICFDGGGCAQVVNMNAPHTEPGNRDMLEYYTMTIDPDGKANIAYSDTLNNCPQTPPDPLLGPFCQSNAWFTKQTAGPSAYAPPAAPAPATFAANVALSNGPQTSSGEPNMRVDSHNCLFSASNDGIPTGTANFWKSTDNGATWPAPINPVVATGSQSGDEEVLPFPQASGARPDQIYFADLGADTVNISKSTDGGATWFAPGTGGAAGEVSASTDRQWFAGDRNGANQTIYLWEHEFSTQVLRMNALTNDTAWSAPASGMTTAELIAPPGSTLSNTVPGPVFVDPATHQVYGFLGASTVTTNVVGAPAGKLPNIWEADGPGTFTSPVPPGPFTNHPVWKGVIDSPTNPAPPAGSTTVGSNAANLFNSAIIDRAGNIYVTWSTPNARNGLYEVWFVSSRDHGQTYYGPVKINPNGLQGTMPWIAAGDNGRVDIVFYGTTGTEDPTTSTNDEWNVFFAQSLNGADREPVFTVSQASDHIMHMGPICNIGILCPPIGNPTGRQLKDFFQVAIGPDGLANIAYADTGDSNGNSHVSFARQNGGPLALTNPSYPTCLGNVVPLASVVSRMTHGSITPPFDINLPLPAGTHPRGVECRRSTSLGAGNYTLVFTFLNNLTSVSNAQVTAHDPASGTGSVISSMMGPGPNQYTVNLTGVSTGQYITVTLNSVLDVTGNFANVVGPQMGVLVGDVNADGGASNLDVSLVKAKVAAGATVDSSNFRDDVNADGGFSNLDVSVTKAQVAAGATLPSLP